MEQHAFPIIMEQHDAIYNNFNSGRKLLQKFLEQQPNFVLYVKDQPEIKITVKTIAVTTYVSKEVYYESQIPGPTWISRKRLDEMEEPIKSIKIKIHYTHAKIPAQIFTTGPAAFMIDV
jgi:hypothetical protein